MKNFLGKDTGRNYGLNGNGPVANHRCKANSVRLIDRSTCKNNCNSFKKKKDSKKRTCEFGYK